MSPTISIAKMASGSPSMKSVMREYARLLLACRRIMLPISSTADGFISKTATVASIASINSLQCRTPRAVNFGLATSLSLASVIVTRVPSDPTTKRAMLKSEPPTNSSRL